MILLGSGFILGDYYSLLPLLFGGGMDELSYALKMKAILVLILTIATVVHFIIAYRTNGKERTKRENLFSRGSSMLIFILNLFVMHYGIVIRNLLN